MKITPFKEDKHYKFIDWNKIINIVCLIISLLLITLLVLDYLSNEIVKNLSYSFIAGYIFYLMMNYFPDRMKQKKVNLLLYKQFDLLYQPIFATKKFSDELEKCYREIQANKDGDNTENFTTAHHCISTIIALKGATQNIINELESYITLMSYPQIQKMMAIKHHYIFLVCDLAIKGGDVKIFKEITDNYQNLVDIAESLRDSAK